LLHEFIKNHDGIAYCLIRPDQKVGSTNRLQSLLEYHFHDNYKDLFTDRIVVIDGDLTKKDFFSKCSDLSIDTIINAAANVKHFSQSDDIEKVNICGVENLLEFSRNKNINFIQISTTSIGGDAYKTSRFNNTLLDENTFFFGQDLSNKYCYSKFMAERLCFEEALKGENIKIMRVGNLMGRESDGGFQINFDTNAFLNLVRSFCLIGQVPYNIMVNKIFMDSIDATAKSILLLATTPKENILLHPFNNHQVMVLDIFKVISEFGINVKSVESNDFNVGLKKVLSNHKNILYLNSLLQLDSADNMGFDNINNDLTISILLRLNYQFSIIDDDYLRKCIDHLCKIGFFDL
jgi:thioester reductase-like protein